MGKWVLSSKWCYMERWWKATVQTTNRSSCTYRSRTLVSEYPDPHGKGRSSLTAMVRTLEYLVQVLSGAWVWEMKNTRSFHQYLSMQSISWMWLSCLFEDIAATRNEGSAAVVSLRREGDESQQASFFTTQSLGITLYLIEYTEQYIAIVGRSQQDIQFLDGAFADEVVSQPDRRKLHPKNECLVDSFQR